MRGRGYLAFKRQCAKPGARPCAQAAVLAAFVAVSGCAGSMGAPELTGSIDPSDSTSNLADAQALAAAYKSSPNDANIALHYAAKLDAIGSRDAALAIYADTAARHPKNQKAMGAYGKALAMAGRSKSAAQVLAKARGLGNADWRLLLAEGISQDQSGNRRQARQLYARTAKLAPGEAAVYNNWGLSFALDNDLVKAEKMLRRALAANSATPKVRQNLALIVGLQGRFSEAEKIARTDLSPEAAKSNVAYLRDMLSQPNSWKALKKLDKL
ncbi:MAG: tetratricopeptide repeat protein [Alphaproteobacteria bacterium]